MRSTILTCIPAFLDENVENVTLQGFQDRGWYCDDDNDYDFDVFDHMQPNKFHHV
jgi:hypothetical protein